MTDNVEDAEKSSDWLVGGGAMGEVTRAFDWSSTPLGERSRWPHSLRTTVSMVMEAGLPMALLWGASSTLLFNDAYGKIACRDMLAAFGQSTDAQEGRHAIAEDGRELASYRSPIRLESGVVGGTLVTVQSSGGDGHQQTALKAVAMQNAYLVRLNDAIRQNRSPARIQARAIGLLAEHLGADRTLYAEVSSDQDTVHVRADFCGPETASVVGGYSFAAFGAYVAGAMKQGRTLAVPDVAALSQLKERELAAYRAVDIAAYVAVPLLRDDRVLAFVAVNQAVARAWTSDDVTITEETATRILAAVEQARAETALLQSEKRYRSLFETMYEGFAVAELVHDTGGKVIDFRFVMFNPALERLMRLHRDEVIGRLASEVMPGEYKQSLAVYEQVVETKRPQRFEAKYPSLGRVFNITGFPYHGQRLAILYDDVTECRRAEEEVNHANQQLRMVNERKNAFLRLLSHELRNPMAPICASSYILGQVSPQSEQAKRARMVIDRQVAHMSRLVDELLDVTRISSGKVQLVRKPMDLSTVVGHAVEDHRQEFTNHGVELCLDVIPPDVWIDADATRIAQVLGNLLQNAAKFTPRGGKTTVCLKSIPASKQASVTVRDSGCGIEPKLLSALFDPFTQADKSLHRTQGGLGLGLSIVKGLVELHDGSVSAISDGPQRGAEFTVTLPTIDRLPDTLASPANRAQALPQRILIVEDNQDAADALRDVLLLSGHEIDIARDGREAIVKVRSFRPNIVLCDLGLPVMNGFEVARQLRAERLSERPYLIALSGYAQGKDILQSKKAGFDDHLAKPPSIAALNRLMTSRC